MTVQQLRKEIKELKEEAVKKLNKWPRKRSKEEIDALLKMYEDAGLFDDAEE
jgi:hypothetical protein